jgi:hypothetical protein
MKTTSERNSMNVQRIHPVYLTSGCCENCEHFTEEDFKALGLPYGASDPNNCVRTVTQERPISFTEVFYPLTEEEQTFIGEDWAGELHGGFCMGYAALFRGQKFLFPSLEVCYWSANPPFSRESYGEYLCESPEQAERETQRIAKGLRKKVKPHGGKVFVSLHDGCGPDGDRHTVSVLLPFNVAQQCGSFEQWKHFLAALLPER